MSFGHVAEMHSPSGCEPKDLTEEDTSMLVKPMVLPQTECDVDL